MLPQHHRAVGYLQERPYCPESPLANGSGQKFIARGYHTTGADLCTTSSKKHELNLSKALCRRNFLCRFWYLCWNLTDLFVLFGNAKPLVSMGEQRRDFVQGFLSLRQI
jgi:hypothetical protein